MQSCETRTHQPSPHSLCPLNARFGTWAAALPRFLSLPRPTRRTTHQLRPVTPLPSPRLLRRPIQRQSRRRAPPLQQVRRFDLVLLTFGMSRAIVVRHGLGWIHVSVLQRPFCPRTPPRWAVPTRRSPLAAILLVPTSAKSLTTRQRLQRTPSQTLLGSTGTSSPLLSILPPTSRPLAL
jgi:hypothetical protein